MTDSTIRQSWAAAFARQARSDWELHHRLATAGEADCHALHYLQMACEKIAKAYRIRDLTVDVDELTQHHIGFESFVSAFLLSPAFKEEYKHKSAQFRRTKTEMRRLAREVECLSPAVRREQRPDNSEYPWAAGTVVVAPCDYGFPNLSLLTTSTGRAFLKLVRRAMDEFEDVHIR